jgi:flagellar hook-associated protein 2
MAGIQLSGLVSGLDTQSIISQLMAVEEQPRTRITNEQSQVTKRQSLLQDISTKLTALKTANDDLKSPLTWLDTQTVTSADDSKVGVSRTAGAPPGGYDVAVTQLASAERRTYDYQPPAADGPLTIYGADGTTVRATVNLSAGATVDDAVAAINSSTDANLYAVNVNGDLVLSAKTTGSGSGFSVAGAGTELERVAGQDAQFNINGTDYTRSGNVVTDALPGVQLTLKGKTAAGSTVGVTVGTPGPDKDAITGKVKAFVDAYNALVTTTRADLTDATVPNATTLTDIQKGTLFGDSGLSGMLSSLRSTIGAAVGGLTGLTSLADIGVSTGAANTGTTINQDSVDGKLTLDTSKLSAALDANPLGVRTLLGGTAGTDGFSQAFAASVNPFEGTGGIIQQRIDSASSDLTRIKDSLDEFDERMNAKQDYYQKQFTALETALQQSQSVGSSLASYLGSSG